MKMDLTRPPKLYRYSERRWLDRSLRFGEFRLRPASDYKDMEDSAARTDDEQKRRLVLRNAKITHVSTGQRIIPIGDVVISSCIESDYLVLCLATMHSTHFYEDFKGSDACLIIHNPNEFFNRMYSVIDSVLPRSWAAADGPVSYGRSSKLGVPFTKPEHFMFQFEWRFACLPIPSLNRCEPTMITLGSIEDIAEIVSSAETVQLTSHSIKTC